MGNRQIRLWVACVVIFSGSLSEALGAPPLPYLYDVRLKAKVVKELQGVLSYSYSVWAGGSNIGDLTRFQIDITQPIGGSELPSTGLVNAQKHVIGLGVVGRPTSAPMVPVAFPTVLEGWMAGPAAKGTAKWGVGCDDCPLVRPGTSVSGFVLHTWGLPSVRDFRADPDFDAHLEDFYPDPEMLPEEEGKRIDEQVVKDREAIAFKGKTIGPTAPPKVFDPVKYTEYMQSLRSQSFELHWIKDSYTASELDGKLSAISGQLSAITDQKIPLSKGTKILELGAQFLQLVESNSCKEFECADPRPLTSESYALLFYNMDYFLTQVRKACGTTEGPSPEPLPAPGRRRK